MSPIPQDATLKRVIIAVMAKNMRQSCALLGSLNLTWHPRKSSAPEVPPPECVGRSEDLDPPRANFRCFEGGLTPARLPSLESPARSSTDSFDARLDVRRKAPAPPLK